MNLALWIVQFLLAGLFLFAGGVKLALPLDQLAGPIELPGLFLRFIGLMEVLGGLGLILPGVTGIRPGLTSLAALGLLVLMAGAVGITLMSPDAPALVILPLLTGVLTAWVAWSRRPART